MSCNTIFFTKHMYSKQCASEATTHVPRLLALVLLNPVHKCFKNENSNLSNINVYKCILDFTTFTYQCFFVNLCEESHCGNVTDIAVE